jgi:hypothetical protein
VPDTRLYRVAWTAALVVAAFGLLFLRAPGLLPLDEKPLSFDGGQAMTTLQTVAQQFPLRQAGDPGDHRCALWLVDQLQALGLKPQVDRFERVINGRPVTLENVWAGSGGSAQGAVVVLAKRDSPPLATQGADDNASGIAAVLELAQVLTARDHARPFIFLWTDGDSYGALGASDFVARHRDIPMMGVVALQQIAGQAVSRVGLNGWSSSPHVAPPWLWVLARTSVLSTGPLEAPTPGIVAQLLRLAVPASSGSQGPFVAAGIPAITLSAHARGTQPAADTVATVSPETLNAVGLAAERMVTSMDAAPTPPVGGRDALFFSKYRKINGGIVEFALIVLMTPLAIISVGLAARASRKRLRVWPAAARLGLRLAPWYLVLAVVYLANLLSLLPHSPGAVIPPEAAVSHTPRYLRVLLLVLLLAVAYHYAMAIERRLARQHPAESPAVVLVAHATLLLIAVLVILVNPFSLVLLLPAAVLWPLARPGRWARSLLPVWAGLAVVGVALLYIGLRLGLGATVWWYFFLLLENRTVPAAPIVLGIGLVATTALLGRELHVHTAPRPPEAGTGARGRGAS